MPSGTAVPNWSGLPSSSSRGFPSAMTCFASRITTGSAQAPPIQPSSSPSAVMMAREPCSLEEGPCRQTTVAGANGWPQGPSSSKQGSRAIITADGELDGWIGGACAEPVVIRAAQQVISDGNARLLLLGAPDQFGTAVPEGMTVVPISCQSEGALEIYIEAVLPVPHLVIVGGSPMTHTLAELARALDWRTDLLGTGDFAAGCADERSMVIVATQGHGDEDMIERAVAMNPAYLGLVASRRRGEAVLGYLADRGVPREELGRIRVPAGLDLGRTTHEEMAVAILAELVQLRASGALADVPAPRSQPRAGLKLAASNSELKLAEAVDPVCGM